MNAYWHDDIVVDEVQEPDTTESTNAPSPQPEVRRSSRISHKPTWLGDYVNNSHSSAHIVSVIDLPLEDQFHYFSATVTTNDDPVNFKQAVQCANWRDAMNKELTALEENNTWKITKLPPGKKSIGCKWLFKTKYNPDGSIERYKSRLVVLGCKQVYGIDYVETFAPVAKLTTVRTLLAVAAIQGWTTVQMDVSNAFLNGDLDEIVYMRFSQGYTGMGSRITAESVSAVTWSTGGWVCQLLKSLYGLRQAPRQWFSKPSETLKALGYEQSKTDYSFFYKDVWHTHNFGPRLR